MSLEEEVNVSVERTIKTNNNCISLTADRFYEDVNNIYYFWDKDKPVVYSTIPKADVVEDIFTKIYREKLTKADSKQYLQQTDNIEGLVDKKAKIEYKLDSLQEYETRIMIYLFAPIASLAGGYGVNMVITSYKSFKENFVEDIMTTSLFSMMTLLPLMIIGMYESNRHKLKKQLKEFEKKDSIISS